MFAKTATATMIEDSGSRRVIPRCRSVAVLCSLFRGRSESRLSCIALIHPEHVDDRVIRSPDGRFVGIDRGHCVVHRP